MRNEYTFDDKAEKRRTLIELRKTVADKPALANIAAHKAADIVSGNVMVYIAIGAEMPTDSLIKLLLSKSGVTLYAPYTKYGIITPRKLALSYLSDLSLAPDINGNLPENCYAQAETDERVKLDYCITPLVGFNNNGYRIGYGKGCYDRFFERNSVYKIGFAFDVQRINFEPSPNDVPLDCCVTEKKVIYFRYAGNCG
ncbi:MAG: 5-formyltetrahydrofolate cyclo-ligase [Clostridiales bacterium]|nr:5-formyltetrahydrofolate cyclo-ligase [Clostridiales bacterium]